MSDATLVCKDERRRELVRQAPAFGLDYLEVSDDQLLLTVVFLGKAPPSIQKENVRVDGGRRITGIQVTQDPDVQRPEDSEADDWMTVHVDKSGDLSTYTLRLVDANSNAPMQGFDVRYASLDFSFKAGCPSDLDCAATAPCPPPAAIVPEINYLAKDYGSFRQLILDRLALIMPDWTERHAADIGITLVEILAYVGDQLSYFQDAVATEAYLATARQRISVRRHARLVDYHMHEGCNARTWVFLNTSDPVTLHKGDFYFLTTIPNVAFSDRTVLLSTDLEGVDFTTFEVFQPIAEESSLDPSRNEIPFYTWGDTECCIPAGATRATLAGSLETLKLRVGDFLLFEEVLGPKTAQPADADPSHRHVVRVTSVTGSTDALTKRDVVEIAWAREDAPPFTICLSTIGPAPDCKLIENVSIARGNIILVDHGRSTSGLDIIQVLAIDEPQCCEGIENPSDPRQIPVSFKPQLNFGALTFAQLVSANAPASTALTQDPAQALPSIHLWSTPGGDWTPKPDLLRSQPDDRDFTIEVDDDGIAHLRFGDGNLGRVPEAGSTFQVDYRVGIGRAGHIGAEAISHIVFQHGFISGVQLKPRNPLPASGGIDPEPVANAKQLAPFAFHQQLKRAITPRDYATLAETLYEPRIRQAEARFLWTGSWYEAAVAIEPFGDVPAEDEPKLVRKVGRDLYRYRRIAHDVRVRLAEPVPIELRLDVCVLRDYQRGHVEAALLEVFSNRVLAGGKAGFFYPDSLGLGEPLAVSRIVAAAQAVTGVEDVQVTILRRKFSDGEALPVTGTFTVEPWQVVRLDNDPSFPENGTLKINLRGGR